MKNLKKLLMLILMLVFVTTACQSAPETSKELIEQSNAAVEKEGSYTADYTSDMKLGLMGQELNIKMNGNIRQIIETLQSEMMMNIEMVGVPGQGQEENTIATEVYIEKNPENEQELITYTKAGENVQKQRVNLDETQAVTIEDTMNSYIEKSPDSFVLKDETEEIDGTEVYVVEGTLPKEVITEMLNSTSSNMDLDQVSIESNSEITGTYYYDVETKLPKRAIISAPDLVIRFDLGIEGAEPQTINSGFTTTLDYTGFGNVDAIEIPEAIKNAQ